MPPLFARGMPPFLPPTLPPGLSAWRSGAGRQAAAELGMLWASAGARGDNGCCVAGADAGAVGGVSEELQCSMASTEICRISKCKNSSKLPGL